MEAVSSGVSVCEGNSQFLILNFEVLFLDLNRVIVYVRLP